MFYLFLVDVLLLGYIGAQPPSATLTIVGEVATFFYFAIFALLPFTSYWENRMLLHREKLPVAALTLIREESFIKVDPKGRKGPKSGDTA